MKRQSSRRQFIRNSALAGAGFWVAGGVSSAGSTRWKNEEIQFAAVGVGGKGHSDSDNAARHGVMVAICDVDENTLAQAAKRFPEAKKFHDYREMFAEMGDKIDAVTVSTPDHTHAVAAAAAMKLKKHAYVQKPLTRSIYEARVLGQLAREHKLATQMGNQGSANEGLRRAAEIVRAGALGKIKECHVWTNRPIWPQGIDRPKADREEMPPPHLHWEDFLGPAPSRPYVKDVYHPFKWRGWWDFGTGALGDMACHTVNMPFHALDLRDPLSVEAESSGHNGETYPKWSIIKYQFGPAKHRGPISMTWYDGGKKADPQLLMGVPLKDSGALIVGEEGSLYSQDDYGGSFVLLPKEKFKDYKGPEPTLPRAPGDFETGHVLEWIRAIKGGEKERALAFSNFPDYAGPLTETILLGNLAVWAGKKVEWNAKELKPTNAPELVKIVKPEYRKGYTL
jgi:predicted dehydrogenase